MSPRNNPVGTRPWEVTVGAVQAVIGGGVMVVAALTLAGQLDSAALHDTLTQLTTDPRFASLNLTLDGARSLLKYTLMGVGGLGVTSLVLGVFVLRRHRPSHIALTVLGSTVALFALFAGPPGWLLAAYVGLSLALLWTRSSRAWFSPGRPAAA
jgi:hypothetical protein